MSEPVEPRRPRIFSLEEAKALLPTLRGILSELREARSDLTQVQAGEILGIKQPHVSLLMRNRSGNFSVERLMDFLTALGHDVEIRVRRTRKAHGAVSVIVAA